MLLVAFGGTYYVIPHSIRKLRQNGYVAKDMYKQNKPDVPTNLGMIIFFTSFLSIAISPLVGRILNMFVTIESPSIDLSVENLAFLLVVSIYSIYGLIDDLVDIGRKLKTILPVAFSYPLISIIYPTEIWIPFAGEFDLTLTIIGDIRFEDIFRILIIPVYVMVVSNLVNMHSGYNGLQSGLSIILLVTLSVKSWSDGILKSILPTGAFLGSMLALWFFNKYPSKAFEGNIGSLLFGSVIGCTIVIQKYWWFGFFILIPHTINFILWFAWLIMIRLEPENYLESDGLHKKFVTTL